MAEILRRVLRKNQLCAVLHWSPSTLYENINKGEFPAPLKDGKTPLWLEEWAIEHQQKLLAEQELRQRQIDDNAASFKRALNDRKVANTRRRRAAQRESTTA